MAPDHQNTDGIDEDDEQHLREHGVAQPDRRSECRVEPGPVCVRDQVAIEKDLRHRTHAAVHDQFGSDQERHRDEKAHVDIDVEQERNGCAPAERLPVHKRERREEAAM